MNPRRLLVPYLRPLLLILALFSAGATAAAAVRPQGGPFAWVQRVDAGGANPSGAARAIAFDSQGNVIAGGSLGHRTGTNNASDFIVVKYDPAGTELWRFTLPGQEGSPGQFAAVRDLAVDVDDSIIAVGFQPAAPPGSIVVKLDPDGNVLWSNTMSPNNAVQSGAQTVALDSAGDVIVGGAILNGLTSFSEDWAVVKFAGSSGARLWTARNDGDTPAFNAIFALALADNDDVAAAGMLQTSAGGSDFLVLKINGATGSVDWLHTEGVAGGSERAISTAFLPGGDVVAAGALTSATGNTFSVVRLNSLNGNRLWLSQIPGPAGSLTDVAVAALVDPQGNLFAAGHVTESGLKTGATFTRLNPTTGARLWTTTAFGPQANPSSYLDSAALDQQGNLIAGGGSYSLNGGGVEFTVYKVSPGGGIVFVRVLTSNGDGEAAEAAADADGNVAAGGYSIPPGGSDVQFTVVYGDPGPTGGDLEPPLLENCEVTPLELPASGGRVTLSVEASDNVGVEEVNGVITGPEGGELLIIPLVSSDGSLYSGPFDPPANTTSEPQVYTVSFEAFDAAGNPAGLDCDPFTVAAALDCSGELSVSPTQLRFTNGAVSKNLTLRNVSKSADLSVRLGEPEGPFALDVKETEFVLGPGESRTVRVVFTGSGKGKGKGKDSGSQSGELVIESSDCSQPTTRIDLLWEGSGGGKPPSKGNPGKGGGKGKGGKGKLGGFPVPDPRGGARTPGEHLPGLGLGGKKKGSLPGKKGKGSGLKGLLGGSK